VGAKETRVGNFSRKASPHPSKAFNKDSRKSSHFTIEDGIVSPFLRTKLVKYDPFLKVLRIHKGLFQKSLMRVKGRALAHPLAPLTDKLQFILIQLISLKSVKVT